MTADIFWTPQRVQTQEVRGHLKTGISALTQRIEHLEQ